MAEKLSQQLITSFILVSQKILKHRANTEQNFHAKNK